VLKNGYLAKHLFELLRDYFINFHIPWEILQIIENYCGELIDLGKLGEKSSPAHKNGSLLRHCLSLGITYF